ncbi:hypothetical protein JMUB7465_26910 [Staphylococcus aureus]
MRTLQQAVQSGEYSDYQEYAKLVNERPATTLRDLLAITPGENAVNIADVEPASELFKRFDTAAMSIGALSPEAHETSQDLVCRLLRVKKNHLFRNVIQ